MFVFSTVDAMLHVSGMLKRTLSGLRQFLETESPLKMMKTFYFTLKALFFLKIFKFLSSSLSCRKTT